jgi:hypothetical protein
MKVYPLALALSLALLMPSYAQQTSPETQQAVANKLMSEINAGIQCSASIITLRRELETAQAQIKSFTEKVPETGNSQKSVSPK